MRKVDKQRYAVVPVEIRGKQYYLVWDTAEEKLIGQPYTEQHNAERRAARLNAR